MYIQNTVMRVCIRMTFIVYVDPHALFHNDVRCALKLTSGSNLR